MQSSPFPPSSSIPMQDESQDEPKLMRTILLVKEEDLDKAKSTFDTISSIHIYSLQASSLKDLQVLTECNRQVSAKYASEDPLEAWKQYGTIQNQNVRRRTKGKGPPAAPPVSLAPAQAAVAKAKPPTQPSKTSAAVESKPKAESKPAATEPEKKAITKPTATKRQSSDLFKSFAKAKPNPKKEESASSAEASPASAPAAEDVSMTGFSDDEGDDEIAEQLDTDTETKLPSGKSKKDRQEELKAMMDAEDDDLDENMEDAGTGIATPTADSPAAGSPVETREVKEEPKETVTVENGRRRGRRRVMKKKTVKDEEGYLGTLSNSCGLG